MRLRGPWRGRGRGRSQRVLGACLGDFARGLGDGVLDEDAVVEVDEPVVVLKVVGSEAEETDVGEGGGSRTAGVQAGCCVLWAMRSRARVRAAGVCARFPWFFGVHAGAGVVAGVMCGVWCVVELPQLRRQVSYPGGGGPLELQDVWVCLLEAFAGAEEALLDARHVLFRELGVVLGGAVWARPQQGHEAGYHHVRAAVWWLGVGGVGPMRFRGVSLCWGRWLTFHVHCSAGICQVRLVHLARQYIALPRPRFRLWIESSVSRDLRPHLPQIWGVSGSSSLVYVLWPGLCGGGGSSQRG